MDFFIGKTFVVSPPPLVKGACVTSPSLYELRKCRRVFAWLIVFHVVTFWLPFPLFFLDVLGPFLQNVFFYGALLALVPATLVFVFYAWKLSKIVRRPYWLITPFTLIPLFGLVGYVSAYQGAAKALGSPPGAVPLAPAPRMCSCGGQMLAGSAVQYSQRGIPVGYSLVYSCQRCRKSVTILSPLRLTHTILGVLFIPLMILCAAISLKSKPLSGSAGAFNLSVLVALSILFVFTFRKLVVNVWYRFRYQHAATPPESVGGHRFGGPQF